MYGQTDTFHMPTLLRIHFTTPHFPMNSQAYNLMWFEMRLWIVEVSNVGIPFRSFSWWLCLFYCEAPALKSAGCGLQLQTALSIILKLVLANFICLTLWENSWMKYSKFKGDQGKFLSSDIVNLWEIMIRKSSRSQLNIYNKSNLQMLIQNGNKGNWPTFPQLKYQETIIFRCFMPLVYIKWLLVHISG